MLRKKLLLASLLLLSLLALVMVIMYRLNVNTYDNVSGNERLTSRTCNFHYSSYLNLECFYYKTEKEGGFILPLALLSPKDAALPKARQDRVLVVYIPGGPGQGGMVDDPVINDWVAWMAQHNIQFDLLLFDPRGTKKSIPAFDCDIYQQVLREVLAKDLAIDKEVDVLNATLQKCFQRAELALSKPSSSSTYKRKTLDAFASVNQAKDINGMLAALGYQKAVLWGVSYGSRLALTAADSNRVAGLILESPYPFSKGVYSDWIRLYIDSFKRHEKVYGKYRATSISSYHELYERLLKMLDDTPIKVDIELWENDEKVTFLLNSHRLLEVSFSVLYSPHLYQAFYQGLENYLFSKKIDHQLMMVLEEHVNYALANDFSPVVYFATECLDNQVQSDAILDKQQENLIETLPFYQEYFQQGLSNSACSLYPFSQSLHVQNKKYTNKATLIIVGEHDPVTPKEWGVELENILTNAEISEIKGGGHASAKFSQCNWEVLNTFVENNSTDINLQCHWPE
ncbi:MAG: alpha/beta hydrolase [Agarilytica sp.]